MRHLILLFYLLNVGITTLAQKNKALYSIVYFKGIVEISTSSKPLKWQKLTSDTLKLKAGCQLRLGQQAQIALKQNEHYTYYTTAGTYTLPAELKKSKEGCLSNFLQYIADRIFHHAPDVENDKERHIDILGGVARGNSCSLHPLAGRINGDSILFTWQPSSDDVVFLTIYEDEKGIQEVFTQKISKDTFFYLYPQQLPLLAQKVYWWRLQNNGKYRDCSLQILEWVPSTTFIAQHQPFIDAILLNINDTLQQHILIAQYLADKGYMDAAMKYYAAAKQADTRHNNGFIKEFEYKYIIN